MGVIPAQQTRQGTGDGKVDDPVLGGIDSRCSGDVNVLADRPACQPKIGSGHHPQKYVNADDDREQDIVIWTSGGCIQEEGHVQAQRPSGQVHHGGGKLHQGQSHKPGHDRSEYPSQTQGQETD